MKQWRHVNLTELVKPKDHHEVYLDRWWITHPENGALFWGDIPQCNRDRRIPEMMVKQHTGHEVQLIPVAYIPIRQEDT